MRLLAALLFTALAANAQPDCSAAGVVVNSVTGAPIVRAGVTMLKDVAAVLTDESGRWRFDHLPCGSLTINASRQNFLSLPARQVVQPVAGTPLHDVTIRLAPQSVVTGRVVDNNGDPIQNAIAFAKGSNVSGGVRRFNRRFIGQTNDIGEYRIAGLPAGKYILCASGSRLQPSGEQCSSPMTVPAGYSGSVDFQLTPLTTRHVRGVISGVPEDVTPQVVLSCQSASFPTAVGNDGKFDVANVPVEACSLLATVFYDSDRLAGFQQVAAGASNVDGIQLKLDRNLDIPGEARVESPAGKEIDTSRFFVSLGSAEMPLSSQSSIWNEDRTAFTVPGVIPGKNRLRVKAPPPFYVKRATLDGRDIAELEFTVGAGATEIEVVLTDSCGVIEGDIGVDVRDTSAVLVQDSELRQWQGETDSTGHFKIEDLPPGDYKVSAWDDLASVEYANPVWMQINGKLVSVSVQAGQSTRVSLVRKVAPNE